MLSGFSTMDLASSYWQIPIRKQDQPKTSFVSKLGQYEFLMIRDVYRDSDERVAVEYIFGVPR